MITYTPANGSDIASIFRLCKEQLDAYEDFSSISYSEALCWIQRKIQNHIADYRVIWKDHFKVGYYYFHKQYAFYELDDFYLFPPFRSQGIGTQVLHQLLHSCATPVLLYVFVQNTRAVSFYHQMGFQIIGHVHQNRYRMRYSGASFLSKTIK